MLNRTKRIALLLVILGWTILIPVHWANAHFGGFIIQAQDGRLIIGQDSETVGGQPNWNTQAVGSLFGPEPAEYSDLPSFLSMASPLPTGTQALPPLTNLYWDFLPMTVGDYTSNLLYWNGQGAVNFGPVPIPSGATDVTIGMYNTTDGTQAIVSDTPEMIAGALLGVTNNSGIGLRLHRHNYWLLDDGDGVAPTNVAEGVYLLALQIDMPGHGITRPIFVVPGTYGIVSTSLQTLTTAVAWVEDNAGLLIRDGDYGFDGQVDSADHTTWSQQYGFAGPWPFNGEFADGNRDAVVDAADYVVWRKFLDGGPGGASPTAAVPEPCLMAFCIGAAAGIITVRRARKCVALNAPR